MARKLSKFILDGEEIEIEDNSSAARIDELDTKVDNNFNTLDTKIDTEVEVLDNKIDTEANTLDTKIDSVELILNQKIEEIREQIVGNLFPVGAVIFNDNCATEQDVITRYGGIHWDKIEGRFLLGSDADHAVGTTGGSLTNSHTHDVAVSGTVGRHVLTVSEMPSHSHSIPELSGSTNNTGSHTHQIRSTTGGDTGAWVNGLIFGPNNPSTSVAAGNHSHTVTTTANNTDSKGSNGGHNHTFTGATVTSGNPNNNNNMPPYLVTYIWKRIE